MGQIEPRRAQFMRSSTFEITYSAAFGSPVGDEAEGGSGLAYGVGEAVDEEDKAGAVV